MAVGAANADLPVDAVLPVGGDRPPGWRSRRCGSHSTSCAGRRPDGPAAWAAAEPGQRTRRREPASRTAPGRTARERDGWGRRGGPGDAVARRSARPRGRRVREPARRGPHGQRGPRRPPAMPGRRIVAHRPAISAEVPPDRQDDQAHDTRVAAPRPRPCAGGRALRGCGPGRATRTGPRSRPSVSGCRRPRDELQQLIDAEVVPLGLDVRGVTSGSACSSRPTGKSDASTTRIASRTYQATSSSSR